MSDSSEFKLESYSAPMVMSGGLSNNNDSLAQPLSGSVVVGGDDNERD